MPATSSPTVKDLVASAVKVYLLLLEGVGCHGRGKFEGLGGGHCDPEGEGRTESLVLAGGLGKDGRRSNQ